MLVCIFTFPYKSFTTTNLSLFASFSYFRSIVECHIVIICVNAEDAGACGERLNKFDLKQHKYNVTIFSLVRGVRSSGALKDELGGNKKTAFIEGVVGFAVVPNPVTDALTSTIPNPSIALERMSTETADIANGAVNLLEALDWTIIFRKVLTPLSWGVIVYECLYALNTVTGGTINDTLFIDNSRVIFACMIRECRHSLLAASRGGKWRPDLTLVFASGNLWCFEMILALPNPFFGMAKWIFGLPAANSLGPGCVDLAAGRETCILAQLEELISSGSRHTMDMHICQSVADRIKSMESALGDNLVLNKPVPGKNQLQLLMSDIKEKEKLGVKLSSSTRELLVWLLRMFTAMSLIYLLWFVFIHDY